MSATCRVQFACFAVVAAALFAVVPGQVSAAEKVRPWTLCVVNRDGSQLHTIVQVADHPLLEAPRWSHDKSQIGFSAALASRKASRLYVVKVSGGQLRNVGQGGHPCWSTDDKQLAYSIGEQDGQKPGVWVQNIDGRGRQWLTTGNGPCWSPAGDRMALEQDGELFLYDLIEGSARSFFAKPPGKVLAGFDWAPDGSCLAVIVAQSDLEELWLVDATGEGSTKLRLTGKLDGQVAWSPTDNQLAIARDGKIQLLSASGSEEPRLIPRQPEGINRMPTWSPDGQQIAFVSDAATATGAEQIATQGKWQLKEVARYNKGTIVYGLAFTPDGRRVVAGGDPANHGVHVLDLESGELTNLGGQGIRVEMFPDGRRFATSWLSPVIQIIDIDSHDVLLEMTHGPANVRALAVSPDGRRLVSGGLDKLLHVWDTATGELLQSFDKHEDWLTQAIFTPDGREVISADHGKKVRIWNAKTGEQRLELAHPAAVWGVAVSPDGQQILTGTGGSVATSPQALKILPGDDATIRLWNAADGRLVREMKGHEDAAYSLDISPDGRLAASAGWDGVVCLWDLQTGERLSAVDDREGRTSKVKFSPDGQRIVVGGGGRRVDRQIVMFPEEQLRVYRLVEAPLTDKSTDDEN